MMPRIHGSWYKSVNKSIAADHAEQITLELFMNDQLSEKIGNHKNDFIVWASYQRLDYQENLESEVVDYLRKINPKPKRFPTISRQIRYWVFERDNYTCSYCGISGVDLECDHIIPRSKGGNNDFDNLTTACVKCNRQKRAQLPEDFISRKLLRKLNDKINYEKRQTRKKHN